MEKEAAHLRVVYVTTKDRAEAEAMGRVLVGEKLCACVNIVDGMRAIYEWQGRIESADEAVLLCKTHVLKEQAVYERIRALHSYELPCILSFAPTAAHPAYLAWLWSGLGLTLV